MKLLAGRESLPRIRALLSLTAIRSEAIVTTLEDHYCRGMALRCAATINDADLANVRKAQKKLESVAAVVEQIKLMDWAHLQEAKAVL